MRALFGLLALALAVAASAQEPAPEVLVAQILLPGPRDENDPNVLIAPYLAEQLQQDARVQPILWSMADPLFRRYVETGIVSDFDERPSIAEVRETARKLRVDWVILVVGQKTEDRLLPFIELFRGTRPGAEWKFGTDAETQEMEYTVLVNNRPDWDSSARSIARTVALKMGEGPFSRFPRRPVAVTPDPQPGTTFEGPTVNIGPALQGNALERAGALIQAGNWGPAILLMRDEIDANPTDPAPRVALVQALTQNGLPEQAALEARRAAALTQDGNALRLAAARAWLADANVDEAQKDLNDALARGADGPEAWTIQGEIHLLRGESQRAVDRFARALEVEDLPAARMGLAIAYALAGRADEAADQFAQVRSLGPDAIDLAYRRAIQLVDRSLIVLIDELRTLPQVARLKAREPEVIARAATAEARVRALSALMGSIPVPERFRGSHDQRDLAHKLLAQSAQEILVFAQTADEDLGSGAAISLGEALKLLPGVRRLYDVELRGLARPERER